MHKSESLNANKYRLSDILELHSGYPWRGAIKEKRDGNVWAVQPKDISETGELLVDKLTRTELTGKKQPLWLTKGDVLVINKGTRNTVAYIAHNYEHVTCAPTLYFIRPKKKWLDKINMKFIAWQLSQVPAQNHFKRSAEGSLQVSLRRQVVEDTPLALPSLDVQNTLARLYDDAIQEEKLLMALIENRKQQMTAIANQLLK